MHPEVHVCDGSGFHSQWGEVRSAVRSTCTQTGQTERLPNLARSCEESERALLATSVRPNLHPLTLRKSEASNRKFTTLSVE